MRTGNRPTATVKTKIPLLMWWRVPFPTRFGVAELDLVWTSHAAWSRRPEAISPFWKVLPIGPFVIAASLVL